MTDYYQVLGLQKDATEADIKKAYRQLALKWHPDKHTTDKHIAQKKFLEINEAYDFLMNPQKRTLYDKFGDGSAPQSTHHAFPFGMHDATRIFNMFFQKGTPLATAFQSQDSPFGVLFNGVDVFSMRKDQSVQHYFRITLEDMCNGITKTLRITQPDGTKKEITVRLDPGTLPSTLTFAEVLPPSNPNKVPGDLVIVVDEIPHNVFKRDGLDIVYTQPATLVDLLCGKVWHIPSLSKEEPHIMLDLKNVIVKPPHRHVIADKGLPQLNNPSVRGNLIVQFVVEFPNELSDEQKVKLREILSV